MKNTWQRLIRELSDDERRKLSPATSEIEDAAPIWLEPLAEIIDSFVRDRGILVSTYVDVCAQLVNLNHSMLVKMDSQQITLNMDTLLEAAGGEAWHLHGRWDMPESIITTVRQYSDGLSVEDQHRLLDELNGRNLLVIGYSGRDTDVMPILKQASPATIHWMHYGAKPLAASVQRLSQRLGDRMTVFSGGAQDVLPLLPQPRVIRPTVSSLAPPRDDRFNEIPPARRMLAAAGVAHDLGLHEIVIESLRLAHFRGQDEISRRQLLARAYGRSRDTRSALRILLKAPSDLEAVRVWPRVATEIAAALHADNRPRIAGFADRVLTLHPRTRYAARIRTAAAHQSGGRLQKSADSLARITQDPLAHRQIGVTGLVDALTVYADTLKLQGRYPEALAAAQSATAQGAYANWSQRAFASRRLGEIAHIAGLNEVAINEDTDPLAPEALLSDLHSDALDRRDLGVAFWTAACLADLHVEYDKDQSRWWLDMATRWLRPKSPVAATYLLLVEAERSRRWESAHRAVKFSLAAWSACGSGRLHRTIVDLSLTHSYIAARPTRELAQHAGILQRRFTSYGANSLAVRAMVLAADTYASINAGEAAEWLAQRWAHEADEIGPANLGRVAWPVLL